jgi:hypothetical protein
MDMVNNVINAYEAEIRQEEKLNRGMVDAYDADTGQCTIYHHFCRWDGMCVLVYMFDDILLEVVKIPRIGDIEDAKYWAPVILYYEFPDWRDPYGWSLWDTMEDDVKMENLLINLFKINVVRNVTGDKTFFDASAFPNISLLKKRTLYNQYIPVNRTDYTRPISDTIYTVPEKVIGADAYNLLQLCKEKANEQTHIGAIQQGVTTP